MAMVKTNDYIWGLVMQVSRWYGKLFWLMTVAWDIALPFISQYHSMYHTNHNTSIVHCTKNWQEGICMCSEWHYKAKDIGSWKHENKPDGQAVMSPYANSQVVKRHSEHMPNAFAFLAQTMQLLSWTWLSLCPLSVPLSTVCLTHLLHNVPFTVCSWNFQE